MQKNRVLAAATILLVGLVTASAPSSHALHMVLEETSPGGLSSGDAFMPTDDTFRNGRRGLLPPHPFDVSEEAQTRPLVAQEVADEEDDELRDGSSLLALAVAAFAAMGFVWLRRRPPN